MVTYSEARIVADFIAGKVNGGKVVLEWTERLGSRHYSVYDNVGALVADLTKKIKTVHGFGCDWKMEKWIKVWFADEKSRYSFYSVHFSKPEDRLAFLKPCQGWRAAIGNSTPQTPPL